MLKIKSVIFLVFTTIGQAFNCQASDILPAIGAPYGVARPRANFVQDLLGTTEIEFARLPQETQRARLETMQAQGFHYGNFTITSLNELQAAYNAQKATHPDEEAAGSFYVIVGNDPLNNPLVYQQVDTGSLQAHWGKACQEKGKRLAVMVASNSNGLETVGYQDTPTDITRYIYDNTQGPAASISAAAGTLLRNYFAFYGDEKPGKAPLPWRQDANHQLNFLKEMLDRVTATHGINIPMSNGYLAFRTPDLATRIINAPLLNAIATTFETNRGAIQVGVHTNVTVSHGLREGNSHRFLNNPEQRSRINQVFCAGLDLGQGTNPNIPATCRIAKVLLQAQIEATLLAAYLNNSSIVILSMLGCGAFANDPTWLIGAIEQCEKIILNSGMHVVLNLFSGEGVHDNDFLRNRLIHLTHATGGSYLQYSQINKNLICTSF